MTLNRMHGSKELIGTTFETVSVYCGIHLVTVLYKKPLYNNNNNFYFLKVNFKFYIYTYTRKSYLKKGLR